MRSYLQFLTTPTVDTPGATLLLHFDSKRYLIGSVAEGTQRAAIQQGARLLKCSDVFISGRTEWRNNGGLIGLILTLADAAASSSVSVTEDLRRRATAKLMKGNQSVVEEEQIRAEMEKNGLPTSRLNIVGSRNLNYMLATARRFVFRKGMPVDVKEVLPEAKTELSSSTNRQPFFEDENVKVWAMAISPKGSTTRAHGNGTVSPRKRSHDEANGKTPVTATDATTEPDLSNDEKTTMMAKAVVAEMFDSTWRMDALVETPINNVQLPATLFVRNSQTNKLEKYSGPMPGGPERVPDIKVLVRRPWPGALISVLPPTEPAKEAISYIFKNHPQRGKFNPAKAIELGLTNKYDWGVLTKGGSLTNKDGIVITPDMVLGQGKEGGGIAIVDLPSPEYVEPALARAEWKSEDIMAGVGVFVWILGPGVAESPALKQFMEQTKDMKHVVASPETCANRLSLDSAAEATIRLARVDPARYVVPVHDSTVPIPSARLPDLVHAADRGFSIQLEPSIDLKADPNSPMVRQDLVVSEMSEKVLDLASQAQEDIKADQTALEAWASKIPDKDAEIVTLGTGSALPSKYRNVSATLLRVPGWGSMLFDCGENTLGQLQRVFAPDEFQQVMKELRMIWISHMHADHHLGTVSVIKEWYKIRHGSQPGKNPNLTDLDVSPAKMLATKDRLAVVSDSPMLHWLYEYSQVEDYGYSRLAPLHLSPARFTRNDPSNLSWFLPPTSSDSAVDPLAAFESPDKKISRLVVPPHLLDLTDMQAVSVTHCHGALAVSLTWPSGFKASYSGDCRPNNMFARIGRGSTVCIHEATFDDELEGDAIAKNHSTTSEALDIAQKMDAKACVLTHFSQRYQKVPVLEYTDDGGSGARDQLMTLETSDEVEDVSTNPEDDLAAPLADAAGPLPTQPEEDGPSSPRRDANGGGVKQTTIKLRSGSDMKVCVAFDYMRVKVGEIAQMEKFTPALLALFAEEEKEKVVVVGGNGNGNGRGKKGNGGGGGGGGGKAKSKRFN